LLDEPLRTLGSKEKVWDNDFTKCLRQEILKWTCRLDHPNCAIVPHYVSLHYYLLNHEEYP